MSRAVPGTVGTTIGAAAVRGDYWANQRLGVRLSDGDSPLGLTLGELAGVAVRQGTRRSHLLVSSVLGKHVPTDPRIVVSAGLLLGRHVARTLTGAEPADPVAGQLLRQALAGRSGAAGALLCYASATQEAQVTGQLTVLGYAETATALGHLVADVLPGAVYLHSTRRTVRGLSPFGGFEEEHSHATSHLLLPADPALLHRDGPLVLVDDELSTGQTMLNTVALLHRLHPRERYVVATLVDVRSPEDQARMAEAVDDLGARLDVVALITGTLVLSARATAVGAQMQAAGESARERAPVAAPTERPVSPLRRIALRWPADVRECGRHGFTSADRPALERELRRVVEQIAPALAAEHVLVLGCEELMYAPLRLAGMLLELTGPARPADVRFSTTTRSPVLVVDEPGYPIRTGLRFPAHDAPSDSAGSAERYAYNVGGREGGDHVVVVVDAPADTPALAAPDGLLAQLRALGGRVTLVVLPSYTPSRVAGR